MRPSTSPSASAAGVLDPEPLYRELGTRSTAVVIACVLYLGHLFFQGKIGSSETHASFALVFVVSAVAAREVRLSLHVLCFPLAVYGLASSASSMLSGLPIHATGEFMLWIKMATFPAAIILFRTAPVLRRWALRTHGLMLTILSTFGIVEYFATAVGQRDLEHRITGGETHVMTFSGILLPLSLLFAVLAFREREKWMLIPAATGAFALLLTLTRSAWLAWLAAVFALIILVRPRLMAFAVPLLILFVTFIPGAMFSRVVSIFDTRQESNFDRIRMLQAGAEIIRDHTLLGVGPTNIKPLYPLYRAPDAPRFRTPHLHNNIVQIWAERGILALAGYVLLMGLFLRECAKGWRGPARSWAEAGVAITVALTVAGLFEFNFGDTEVFYLTLDLFALVVANLESAPSAPVEALAGV